MITQWLNESTIYDPYNEFFIVTNNNNVPNSNESETMEATLNISALPCFLSSQTSNLILRAGMSIQQQQQRTADSLSPLLLSWLDPTHDTASRNQTTSDSTHSLCNLDRPPFLTALSHLDIHLQEGHPSVTTLETWMNCQQNNYVSPVSILLQERVLDPIQHRCQSITTYLSTPPAPPSVEAMGRRDLMFTYWNGHGDQHPTTFHSGLGAPGDLYRYISESLKSLDHMQKNKVMEMGQVGFLLTE
ncbi:hypothetical protein [Absidia glauca]|uniref:Gamma tubulin complex component protein N-terminal domain-containing protein n=1 Tax=Absidia glauca TaxID=4829 RepID=A0A163K6V9_ABSGL|nr:hypothetical protein [Absidia glauca]